MVLKVAILAEKYATDFTCSDVLATVLEEMPAFQKENLLSGCFEKEKNQDVFQMMSENQRALNQLLLRHLLSTILLIQLTVRSSKETVSQEICNLLADHF
ncbi:unnamed protein product [Colias eurytheme]|nr:unnamed protein product [Colias eurytheme]